MLLEERQKHSTLRRIHLAVGLAGTVTFLATGMYMRWKYDGLQGMDALPRMLFRSSHIYLLLTSLINLSFGLYLVRLSEKSRLQWIGSILVFVAPIFMLIGFLIEPFRGSFERPFVGPGVYSVFAGMLLHLIAVIRGSHSD